MALPFVPSDAGLLACRPASSRRRGSRPRAGRSAAEAPARARLGADPDRLDRRRDLHDPLRVRDGDLADLPGAGGGAAARGGRARLASCAGLGPWLALLVVPLFVLAWRTPHSLVGEAPGAALGAQLRDARRAAGAVTPALAQAGIVRWLPRTSGWWLRTCSRRRTTTLSRRRPGGGCRSSRASCSARSRSATATCSSPPCWALPSKAPALSPAG
jgi:hypothetical protein